MQVAATRRGLAFESGRADEIPLASGVENLSSGSMKLQAQEQQDKEEEETYQEAEEAEAEKATEMSLSQSVAEIMKEIKASGKVLTSHFALRGFTETLVITI